MSHLCRRDFLRHVGGGAALALPFCLPGESVVIKFQMKDKLA